MFWRKKKVKATSASTAPTEELSNTDNSQTLQPAQHSPEPAVFEFGRPTRSGLVMQGVCRATPALESSACIWSVIDVKDLPEAPSNLPKYHIEF